MKYIVPYFSKMYSDGGYYDQIPNNYISVETHEDIKFKSTVFSYSYYNRVIPEICSLNSEFVLQMHAVCNAIEAAHTICPTAIELEISDAIIHDSVIYTPTGSDLNILYMTHRPTDRPYVKQLADVPVDSLDAREIRCPGRRLLYLGSAGSFNYGHWLIDDLARIKIVHQGSLPTTVLLQSFSGMDDVRLRSLKYMTEGCDVEFIFMGQGQTVRCVNLTYVTPISIHPYVKNIEALNFLRDFARARTVAVGIGERIFVKRRADRGRRLLNVEAIEAVLAKEGFRSVDPEALSFDAQAEIFANATFIVGVMCAAMCNTIFSASGARVLYLSPNDWAEPFYWDLATVMAHDYRVLYGQRGFVNDAPHFDDFTIDVAELKNTLRAMS